MREIKFRAWDKDEKEMIYGMNKCLMNWDGLQHNVNKFFDGFIPVMQYTGLEDINGGEIYEGDIVWDGSVARKIEFKSGCFLAVIKQGTYLHAIDNLEIIGNIYENPELMESK